MFKKVLLLLSCILLITTQAFAQPTGGGSSGSSGVSLSLGAPADPSECLELDAEGNAISSGVACGGGGGATTEAELESDLTDVSNVYTNNDGVLVGVITDLTDVTGISGNTTVVGTVAGAFTPGDCLQIDASGNIVGTGSACATATTDAADLTTGVLADARVQQSNVTQHQAALSITESQVSDLAHTTDAADLTTGVLADARVQQSNVTQHQAALSITESQVSDLAHVTAPATTEAGLETQITDVSNIFTDNDGALDDDDVSDDRPTDMLPLAHDTYLQALNSLASPVDLLKLDSTDNARFHVDYPNFLYFQISNSNPLRISLLDVDDYYMLSPAEFRIQGTDYLHLYSGTTPMYIESTGSTDKLNVSGSHYFRDGGYNFIPSLVMKHHNADTGFLYMCSGSTSGDDTGACVQAHADLNGFNPGDLYLRAANQAGAEIGLFTSGVRQWDVQPSGDLVNLLDNNIQVQPEAYGVGWDASNEVPTKNDLYDKIETLGGGGGGGAVGTTYYDHTFTWPAGVTASAALSDFTITHNVGRYPDKVVVYMKRGNTTWEQETPFYVSATNNFYGWDSLNAGSDDLNETRIRVYGNTDNAARDALVRLFWHTDDELDAATTGLKAVNGGAGANSLITYYNHNFTWPAGSIATIGAANIESVTHNVGRPPDKVVVYVQGSNGDWTEAQGQWRNQATNYYGWSVDFAGAVDENNVTRIRLFSNEDLTADAALVRLFWYSDDDIASAIDGRVDISTSQGYSAVTASEVLTGDTFNGKAIYNKTLDMSPCPNATTKTLAHGVSGGMEDVMPGTVVMAKDTTSGIVIPFSHAYSASGFDYWQIDTDNAGLITIGTAANRAGSNCIAHLFYTKP